MGKGIPKPKESYEIHYLKMSNYIFITSIILGSLFGYFFINNFIIGALLFVSLSVLIPSFIELFKYFFKVDVTQKNLK
jgi:hypothetical protein